MKSIKEKFLSSIYQVRKLTIALMFINLIPASAHSEYLSKNEIDKLFTHGRILSISQINGFHGANYHIVWNEKFHFCRVINSEVGNWEPDVECFKFNE